MGIAANTEAEYEPKTLLEAIRYYSDSDVATKAFSALRWPDGPICPYCQSKENLYTPSRSGWKCKSLHVEKKIANVKLISESALDTGT